MLKRLTIIALPHAGGASFNYFPMRRYMPLGVDFVAVDPPGHGRRIGEPLLASIEEMAVDIIEQYRDDMAGRYILFGHSMGAALAYEMCCRIDSSGGRMPEMLVVSGRYGPMVEDIAHYSDLPDDQFTNVIKSMGSVPAELIEHPEIFGVFEAILRADFRAIDSYSPSPARRLSVPIMALCGRDDDITQDQLEQWGEVTTGPVDIHMFPGGHFFLFDCVGEVVRLLTESVFPREDVAIAG